MTRKPPVDMSAPPRQNLNVSILPLTPFGEWLAQRVISYAEAARALDVSRACVQQLATGRSTPTMYVAGIIKAWTIRMGGPAVLADSWLPYAKPPARQTRKVA